MFTAHMNIPTIMKKWFMHLGKNQTYSNNPIAKNPTIAAMQAVIIMRDSYAAIPGFE